MDGGDENVPLSLPYNIPEVLLPPQVGSGCSCAYYPPSSTRDGSSVLARNLDFSTGSLLDVLGLSGQPSAPPHVSQPYLIKSRPDKGFPTLTMVYFDLLCACLDGINSEGLTIALLQDSESVAANEVGSQQGAGAQEALLPKLILENCATVDDAKVMFLNTKRAFMEPTHYIVADPSGAATVVEFSKYGSIHFSDIGDGPLCVTNHLLFEHDATSSESLMESRSRLEKLQNAQSRSSLFDRRDIRAAHEAVHQVAPLADSPVRTIWTSIWDMDQRQLEIDLYLGESAETGVRRSETLEFSL